jgi:hypothetical protein
MVGAKHPEQFRMIIKDYFPKTVSNNINNFISHKRSSTLCAIVLPYMGFF